MRKYLLATAMAALIAIPASALAESDGLSAEAVQIKHQRGGDYGRGHWGYGENCRELRRACLNKEELGEVGRGNCQRYREMCR